MTKPGFLPFLMQHPNSILIIEDAENIIRDRAHDNCLSNQAVANLLNLSDGLLGDAMHQQIICTFNCDVQGIDPALLRDGRLVVEHTPQNAKQICKQLEIPGNGEDIHESITLAEIYAKKYEGKNNKIHKKKQKSYNIFGLYS
jgi:SpoVK/Ycf46/Vps4 family AAA+-type ATPase